MTTRGTTRSKINGGKTTATPPTEKVEAVEQLENGRRADGHQNERGGRHNKNKHSQNGQERHGHHGSQGIHHDQHHIHVTTPKMKIHPPTVKLPPVPPEPNLARNCDQLAHLCHVPMYRKVMRRECQKTCGRDECQDDREDL
ncbi:hypothetical protein niasHS_003221 [Heterodera schachtii]|uniref:ShKT domain-containing protein n=1 Tax=Heterodera schachtii TaxID=97005 RepID=A0ABD2KFW0_HETSC